ncbi:MAG TPA: serine/threonine-protein kinase [Kofleriaceae bacterium]|nr:serine/threonine-protein kinase [Kofleriaceae bacterium]
MSCLDAAAVQGYVSGRLAADERAAAEAHVDACDACRKLVAALAMTNADAATPPTANDSPAALRRSAPELGALIDRYQLIEFLGHGGMGIVYKAHDPQLKRDVAIKLLRAEASDLASEQLQARMLREAQAMAQIAHPNVIAVFDVGTWDGEVFIAMELASAGTLRGWCKRRASAEIIAAFVAAGRGLAAAHAAGLVHRDFKPDNVLVGNDGRVRVTDFGLARSHEPTVETPSPRPSRPLAALTVTGTVMGTPGYMAPEIVDAQAADARSDQFAFCVAMWEALYGQRPFAGTSELEIALAAKTGEIVPPASRRDVPRAVEQALRRGLAPERDARWPTMDALLDALAPPPRRAWRYGAAALALVACALVLAAAWPHAGATSATPRDAGIDAVDPKLAAIAAELQHQLEDVEVAREQGDLVKAEQLGADAIARARTIPAGPLLVVAIADHAQTLGWMDRLADSEREWLEARTAAEALGNDPMKTQLSFQLADVLDRRGKHEEADDTRKLALATLSRKSSPGARAAALEADAQLTSNLDDAKRDLEEAYQLRWNSKRSQMAKTAMGPIAFASLDRKLLAIVLVRAGKIGDARDVLVSALATTRQRDATSRESAAAQMVLLTGLAFVELQLDHCSDAETHARQAFELGREQVGAGEPLAGTSLRARAESQLCLGKRAEAQAAFDLALHSLDGRPLQQASALAAMASEELARGDAKDSVEHARASVALLASNTGDPVLAVRVQVLLCRALAAARAAQPPECATARAIDHGYDGRINDWLDFPEPPLLR